MRECDKMLHTNKFYAQLFYKGKSKAKKPGPVRSSDTKIIFITKYKIFFSIENDAEPLSTKKSKLIISIEIIAVICV